MTDEAEAILERLPELLKERPQLRYRLFEVLSQNYSSRDEFNRLLAELKVMREESNRRFEEANRRFEEARQETNRRFEEANRRFEEARQETNRRFEEARQETNRRFEEARQERLDMRHELNLKVGGFTRRAGRGLEDAVAGTFRLALGAKDIRAEHIRMRQHLTDDEGLIGPTGRSYEYDIIVRNGETWIFEVKSAPDEEDVERFADKCELVARKLDLTAPRRVIVTLAPNPEIEARCRERGVELA